MGALYDELMRLVPPHDEELRKGYERFEAILGSALNPKQMAAYTEAVKQTGMIRIFEEMTPEELAALSPEESAIATTIMADSFLSMENRRIAALLNQRGQHDVAPDLTTEAGISDA